MTNYKWKYYNNQFFNITQKIDFTSTKVDISFFNKYSYVNKFFFNYKFKNIHMLFDKFLLTPDQHHLKSPINIELHATNYNNWIFNKINLKTYKNYFFYSKYKYFKLIQNFNFSLKNLSLSLSYMLTLLKKRKKKNHVTLFIKNNSNAIINFNNTSRIKTKNTLKTKNIVLYNNNIFLNNIFLNNIFLNNIFLNNIFLNNVHRQLILIKFLFFNNFKLNKYFFSLLLKFVNNTYYFYSIQNNKLHTNCFGNDKFLIIIKKQAIRHLDKQKMLSGSFNWHYYTLIRNLEFWTGKKIAIKIYTYLNTVMTYYDNMKCVLWHRKLQYFQKTIGHGFFLLESIQIIYLTLKLKDLSLLINWMTAVLHKISFWKHRLFFHYLRYLFKNFFLPIFTELNVKGIKFKLKGKISVTGNARTRTIFCKIGKVSHSTYNNKILQSLDLIRTFTGVMGLQIWLIF
uniref:Ribosomal protein S3b n=1 Tax=Pseudourostyla cristata TaxID=293816 RepID=A0A4P9JLS4_9SPIT|nr:ribosomal protein S3b [Pseudourostyla cristata]